MQENLILKGYALNVEYFSEILHEMRTQSEFANIVNNLVEIPKNADTRDTKAILKISSGYLKLLFPHVKHSDEIDKEDFEIYCLNPARNMRKLSRNRLASLILSLMKMCRKLN
jgi:ATP-dependent Lon protease